MLTLELAEQIALELQRKDSSEVAFLADGPILYFSRKSHPVVSLIQAVYDHRPDHARRILRARIYSTALPTEACQGMLKVSAKRMTAPIAAADHGLAHSLQFHEIIPRNPPVLLQRQDLPPDVESLIQKGEFMAAAFCLSEDINRAGLLYESDRKVAAILISKAGEFIAAARNSNAKNRTRHAEINLVQGLLFEKKQKLPAGAEIYVTLKCCKMCAAMIGCEADDIASLRVYYGEEDPGPNARNTLLSRLNIQFLQDVRSGARRKN